MLCEEWIFWVVPGMIRLWSVNGEERRMEKFEETESGAI